MKNVFLLGIFIASNSFAATGCFLYEVKGVARILNKEIQLVVNKDTMSEFIFTLPTKEEHKLAPYLDVTSVGTYVFKKKPQSKDKILLVKTISRSTPDPINHMFHSYVKELKAVKCQ